MNRRLLEAEHDRTAADFQRFLEQVAAYHEAWQGFFLPRVFARAAMGPADYDAMPAFPFVPEARTAVAGRVGGRVALLSALVLIMAIVCWRASASLCL